MVLYGREEFLVIVAEDWRVYALATWLLAHFPGFSACWRSSKPCLPFYRIIWGGESNKQNGIKRLF